MNREELAQVSERIFDATFVESARQDIAMVVAALESVLAENATLSERLHAWERTAELDDPSVSDRCRCGHDVSDHRDYGNGNTACYYLTCDCLALVVQSEKQDAS